MIKIETTPNLYGITLSGDYQDLNELYDSISRYLNFYQENENTPLIDPKPDECIILDLVKF